MAPKHIGRAVGNLALALVSALAAASGAGAAVDAAQLAAIKAATAFVRVSTRSGPSSGSGFVVQVEGARALVATNAHVVRHAVDGDVEVVLDSGTRRARALPATVLVEDRATDLAILEIKGSKLPSPVALATSDDVVETFELYIVGFPFGRAFATNRDTPTVTVARGTVSSLRLDINDQTRLLQVDGDINPGNSGGPVISGAGEVIGVAVATVTETNIGFAIPARKVRALLAGLVGNVRAVRKVDGVQVIGDWLDPLGRPVGGYALFGPEAGVEFPAPDGTGAWSAITGEVDRVDLKATSGGRVHVSLPIAAGGEDERWIAQIVLETDGVARHQPPLAIKPGKLDAAVEGPNALAEDEPRESVADLERGEAEQADAVLVESLLDASGINELVDGITAQHTLLFGQGSDDDAKASSAAPEASSEEKDVREQLSEILSQSWDRNRLHRHYVDTFLAEFSRARARTALELLKLPAARRLHVDFVLLTTQGKDGMKGVLDEMRRGSEQTRRRLGMFARIDAARGLSRTMTAALHASQLAIRRIVNELQPTGWRMAPDVLEREIARGSRGDQAQMELGVKALLSQFYRDRSDEEIAEYAELVETGALAWLSERESAAFKSMVTLRFAAAETEVRELLRDVQRDAFGVADVELEADMTPAEIVQSTIDAYGVELVIKYLISKSDGQITIDRQGALRLAYGRPRADLISPRSILADLERFDLSIDQFSRDLEDRAVAAGIETRRLHARASRPRSATSGRPSGSGRKTVDLTCTAACRRAYAQCRREAPGAGHQCDEPQLTCYRACGDRARRN